MNNVAMNNASKSAVFVIVLSFFAGVVGIILGHEYIMPNTNKSLGLHDKIHKELVIEADKDEKLHRLELEFARNKTTLEKRMKQANQKLSRAIKQYHQMSPEVIAAKQEYIQTLDELQTLTIEHIFAMRALLSEKQAEKFDEIVQASFDEMAN